jgi:uncharacterized protein involved in exopolysaccharide biosynthesis
MTPPPIPSTPSPKMTDTPHYPEDDEISLLDLLQTIVDNLRLLIIGPLVAGLLAYGVALVIPKTYESTAILKSEQNLAGQMLTASVLDPIAAKLGYTPKMEADDARDKLRKEIKASYNAKDKLVTLTAQATSPQAAQALANDVLEQVYVQTQPRDSAKQSLQKQLTQLQTREKELTQSAKILERRLEQATGNGVSEVAQGYAQLIGVIEKNQESQIKIEKELKGMDSSDLIQSPTLPTKKVAPKRSLIAIIAALAAGFALLLFVFIRQALRNASQNEESAPKINALQASWRKALGKAQ